MILEMNPFGIEEEYYYEIVELLQDCEQFILDFERDTSGEAYKSICRNLHSLKGNCGMLELKELENIFHTVESIFISSSDVIKENIDPYLSLFDDIKEYSRSADENILKMLHSNLMELNKSSLKKAINQVKDESLTKKANEALEKELDKKEAIVAENYIEKVKEEVTAPILTTYERLLVYLLDDNDDFLEVMKISIEDRGHEVKTFNHSDDLRDELIKGNIPDFVIVDYHMGDIKGSSVVNALNTIIPLVPIATCSGYLTYEVLMKMVNSGIVGAMEKPVDYTILDTLLKRALKDKIKNQFIRESKLMLKEAEKLENPGFRIQEALKILKKLP